MLNSLVILSFIISKCNNPRNPHLNPKPNAVDVSGSNTKEASFSFNLFNASLKSSNFVDSIGYNPQNTIDFIGLYPGNGSEAGFSSNVIVSPTATSIIFFILPTTNPTSPLESSSIFSSFGVFIVSSVTSYTAPLCINLILSPTFNEPSTTLTDAITPLYESNTLSNINAFNLEALLPSGDGTRSTIASTNFLTPSPVLALVNIISSFENPIKSINSLLTFSTSAFGKSILFITGIIVRLDSSARYKLASVCASTPWAASTTNIAPSHAARLLDTS